MTQKRHPFHHFVNFLKFAGLGYGIVYVGQKMVNLVNKEEWEEKKLNKKQSAVF